MGRMIMEWLRSILLIVSLSTLGYFSYVKSSTPMEADMRTHSSKVSGQTALLMDEYFAHIANSIQVVSVNQNVIETLKYFQGNSDYKNYLNKQQVICMLGDIQALNRIFVTS